MKAYRLLLRLLLATEFFAALLPAARGAPVATTDWHEYVRRGKLVKIASVDPTIRVELRYATARNCAGNALYPPDFPALVRPAVATRLRTAQHLLRAHGCGLKIWDAYRPLDAQRALWKKIGQRDFVSDPDAGPPGHVAFHCQGLAVDVTLVDLTTGAELPMPTDFDVFTADASGIYRGGEPRVRANLLRLRHAMIAAGFLALHREWWHFTVRDWRMQKPL